MIRLREYQQNVIDTILNCDDNRQLHILPTGAGKTIIFTELTRILLEQNKKVLILAHRNILINQIQNYNGFNRNLLITTKQSYANKLDFKPDYLIIDEVHNVDTLSDTGQYKRIIENHEDSIIIGFTATPIRLNNGLIYGNDRLFKKYHTLIKPIDLIKKEYLVPYKYSIPYDFVDKKTGYKKNMTEKKLEELMTKKILVDAVVDSYVKLARKKNLIFATTIHHAEVIKEALLQRGINAKTIHSNLHKEAINTLLSEFKSNYLNCLINVNMLTEGFDEPQVDTLFLARPTHSIALHRQIIGRGLRISPNKQDCLIVDLVGNLKRLGDINDDLKDKVKKQPNPFICPKCSSVNVSGKRICLDCNFQPEINNKEVYDKFLEDKKNDGLLVDSFKIIDFDGDDDKTLIIGVKLDYKVLSSGKHAIFIFFNVREYEDGGYINKRLAFVFVEEGILFLNRFCNKFNIKLENESPEMATNPNLNNALLIKWYKIMKKNENYFNFRFIEYSTTEKQGKTYFKLDRVLN